LKTKTLQIGAEVPGELVNFCVCESRAHIFEGNLLTVFLARLLEEVYHRAVFVQLDLMRHSLGIILQPGIFHKSIDLGTICSGQKMLRPTFLSSGEFKKNAR